MKALFLLLAFILTTDALAQAKPVSMKGQADAAYTLPKQEIQVPNKQYTNLGGLAGLIETGNFNALSNPGGEAATAGSGWSVVPGTLGVSTTFFRSGLKSVTGASTASALNIIQTSTINIANLTGSQGVASAWVLTTRADMEFCAFVDSVEVGCVDIINDGVGREYVAPFVFGSSSYGVKIQSTASATGTVYVDDAYAGVMPATMTPEVAQAQLGFEGYFATTASATTTDTSTSFVTPATIAAIPGPTVLRQGACTLLTTDSNRFEWSATCPPGRHIIRATPYVIQSAGSVVCLRITDGTTPGRAHCANATASTVESMTVEAAFDYVDSGTRTFTIQVASSTGSVSLDVANNLKELRFVGEYYPPASKVYSQPNNGDTDWVDCGLTTADFTSFGTVSNINIQCKKDGSDLLMKGKFTVGTSVASEARIALRAFGSVLTSAGTSIIPNIQLAGIAARTTNDSSLYTLIEPSTAYMTFSSSVSAGSGLSKATGATLEVAGNSLSIHGRFPIAGWTKSQITGTFKDVVVAPGMGKPKTCNIVAAAAVSSSTACSSTPCTEWFDGCGTASSCTRAATGQYSCTWAAGTFAASTYVFCSISGSTIFSSLVLGSAITGADGSLTVLPRTFNSTPAAADSAFNVSCTAAAP